MLMLPCSTALATTVYKTVNEYGVVSYSDVKPEVSTPVETLVIDVQESRESEGDQERLLAIRETTDRMAADRREREKHRAELRRQTVGSRVEYAPAEYTEPAEFVSYASSSSFRRRGYGNRDPRWRHNRPRPENPIARPPMRPGAHQRPLHPRRFSVNEYPASLIRRHYSSHAKAAFGYH